MTKKFKIFVIVAGILVATALLGNYATLYSNNNSNGESISQNIRVFSDAFMIIKDNYVEDISLKKLIYGALNGMIGSLDTYSQFMEPDIAERVKSDTEGEFGGLGIRITSQDNYVTVITPIKDTPAYEMGIFPGDQIVEIEGESAKGISLRDAVNKLRGEPGTDVTISIAREGEEKLLMFTITRDIIIPRKVHFEIIRDDIGYIRLVEFTGDAPEAIKEAVEHFKQEGIDGGLILDLRNNPGGLLSSAIEVANLFIEKGELVVYTEGRRADQNQKFYAAKKAILPDMPLVVLVNKGSASGSEIVAGSIKDLKRGIVIGETTFGKGSVQSIIDLADGSSMRLTTAHYYTPSGVVIHENGVEPNIEVSISQETRMQLAKQQQIIHDRRKESEEDFGIDHIVDPQLQRSIDILVARKIFFDK